MSERTTDEAAASHERSARSIKLDALLSDARRRLVEIGTRNRLIHTNRRAKKPSTLAVVHESADDLFRQLVLESRALRFRTDPRIGVQTEASDGPPSNEDPPLDSLPPNVLQTRVGEDALQRRLLKFFRDAKTLEEEQGINILYLAVGFLGWYEDDNSQVVREAPLLLIPVGLTRDARRSTFDLKIREDDISINLPLAERLKEFGITLPEVPHDEYLKPSEYFQTVETAIASKSRWFVDRRGVELGLFSFAKLLMFHDLAGDEWPDDAILHHPLILSLLMDGFEAEEPLFSDDTKIDEKFEPADLVHVVDADGSQTLAIETVRAGRNIVIQGPPGTGKSQTIANVIAGAVHDGKTVLFVAEKMVALEVVYSRLKRAGIDRACLELHSRSANKRAVAEELARTINSASAEPNVAADAARLKQVRDALNGISAHLHTQIEQSAKTPFGIIGDLVYSRGKNYSPSEIELSAVICCDAFRFDQVQTATTRLAQATKRVGRKDVHPWRGVRNTALQPLDLERLGRRLGEQCLKINSLQKLSENGATLLAWPSPTNLSDLDKFISLLGIVQKVPVEHSGVIEFLSALPKHTLAQARTIAVCGQQAQEALAAFKNIFRIAALDANTSLVRQALARGTASWFTRLGSPYRSASKELQTWLIGQLPKAANDRVALVDKLVDFQTKCRAISQYKDIGRNIFESFWLDNDTDFNGVLLAEEWLSQALKSGLGDKIKNALFLACRIDTALRLAEKLAQDGTTIRLELEKLVEDLALEVPVAFEGKDLAEISFSDLETRLSTWVASSNRYAEWAELISLDTNLRAAGADDIAERLADGRLSADHALDELKHARAEILWNQAIGKNPNLSSALKENRTALVQEFKKLDAQRRDRVSALIRARHAAAMPRGAFGEMAIIRGEIARRRGHMPIRKLIDRAGRAIQMLKPVFMMSPISVAQYLPPGKISFDLVVIDEASQVRPEDALGVIARGGQIVVVGDRKQLPPTSFFSRLLDDDDEASDDVEDPAPTILAGAAAITALESILTLCEARGLSSRMLRWHYRSRHPSLIEVSNTEFYGSNLFLPPAPAAERSSEGFLLRRVQGAYDRGGKRTNAVEAQAIIDAVAKHAAETPDLSLGVVTFSTAQRDIVSDFLDERRRTDPVLDTFLESGNEEVFVKNLENVQGDERDVILVSVGYGPRQAGARLDSMAFGPVSSEGGERRLNVLFTRARCRCEVFVSFDSGDINLERARGEGPRVLKRFLAYAETGILDQPIASGADHDSLFEEDVAQVIRSCGYLVDAQVGSAGFKIDLAARDPESPGRYILAIECDGSAYHSALWARERDRLRQEVLENMGWQFHRIWSTDWFYRRETEIERLQKALENAKGPRPPRKESISVMEVASELSQSIMSDRESSPYRLADFSISRKTEPHESPINSMADIVGRIVEIEGPIHEEEVARRVASLWGKDRTGSRIAEATRAALQYRRRLFSAIHEHEDFWFTTGQRENCPIRDRSAAIASLQRADMLPPLEISAAAIRVMKENGAISRHEIAVAITRLLGFQRTGPDLRVKIDEVIGDMIAAGTLKDNGRVLAHQAVTHQASSLN
jgi:very-short-patch-repair endonuclease